jgi:hypothetical protein
VIGLRALSIEPAAGDHATDRAAALRRACGHVEGSPRLIDELGFRFYPIPHGDLPHFLCCRFTAGRGNAAITLVAGIDPRSGEPVLEDCRTSAEAARELAQGPASLWLLRVTVGASATGLAELAGRLRHADPAAFDAIAVRLLALPLLGPAGCPLCQR